MMFVNFEYNNSDSIQIIIFSNILCIVGLYNVVRPEGGLNRKEACRCSL